MTITRMLVEYEPIICHVYIIQGISNGQLISIGLTKRGLESWDLPSTLDDTPKGGNPFHRIAAVAIAAIPIAFGFLEKLYFSVYTNGFKYNIVYNI